MTWMGVVSAPHLMSYNLKLSREQGGCSAVAVQVLREPRPTFMTSGLCPNWLSSMLTYMTCVSMNFHILKASASFLLKYQILSDQEQSCGRTYGIVNMNKPIKSFM